MFSTPAFLLFYIFCFMLAHQLLVCVQLFYFTLVFKGLYNALFFFFFFVWIGGLLHLQVSVFTKKKVFLFQLCSLMY